MIIVLKSSIVASTITILRCLRRNITPSFLKKENVTPIFKRGTKKNKIFDQLAFRHFCQKFLKNELVNNNLPISKITLSKSQYGFREVYSTQHFLLLTLEKQNLQSIIMKPLELF